MLVTVHMRPRQSGGGEAGELRLHFLVKLFLGGFREGISQTDAKRVGPKTPVGVNEMWDRVGWQQRVIARDHNMQSYAQCRVVLGHLNRLMEARFGHHEAGAGKNPLCVGAQHGGVYTRA